MVAEDQKTAIIGGMIMDKTIKYTKNDKVMAFLKIEDLVGTVEVVVFPRDYEKYAPLLVEDSKVFIKGRISVEEEKDGKLICEQIVAFEDALKGGPLFENRYGRTGNNNRSTGGGLQGRSAYGQATGGSQGAVKPSETANGNVPQKLTKLPDGVWVQFATVAAFEAAEKTLYEVTADSEGEDALVVFIKESKGIKVLPPNRNVSANEELKSRLEAVFGAENVKFRIKPIENK